MRSPTQSFRGLQWLQETFDLEPQWTGEPDLNAIKIVVVESDGLRPPVTVEFFAQGAFNKLYEVKVSDAKYMMRVALPVDPEYKTRSEVATIEWVRQHTTLPVPEVVAFDATRENPIDFEWILMTRLDGEPLADAWRSIEYSAKEKLVQQLAKYSVACFRKQFSGIGNIFPATLQTTPLDRQAPDQQVPDQQVPDQQVPDQQVPDQQVPDQQVTDQQLPDQQLPDQQAQPKVQRIVSMHFFWGDRIHQDVRRGPFHSSHDWLAGRLSLNEYDCQTMMAKMQAIEEPTRDDKADLDDATRTLKIVHRLQANLEKVFPLADDQDAPEPTMLFHEDLSQHNILVDGDGKLAGVVDWECVSAIPLWKACYFPSFLQNRPRYAKPDPSRYVVDQSDEELPDLYWDHLEEYELTKLRQYFLEEMEKLEPRWAEVFRESQKQRDFDLAARSCESEFIARDIHQWLDRLESGDVSGPSLQDMIDEV